MKKILLIAGLFMAIGVTSGAQEAKTLGPIKEEVGMSKEQYAAYKKIKEENKQAVATLEADTASDVKARKAKKKELNAARDAAILGLLDDTQKAKYQAYEARKKAEKQAKADAAATPGE